MKKIMLSVLIAGVAVCGAQVAAAQSQKTTNAQPVVQSATTTLAQEEAKKAKLEQEKHSKPASPKVEVSGTKAAAPATKQAPKK